MVRPIAHEFSRVVTFEPEPRNFACLDANVLAPHVLKINACVGERSTGYVALMGDPANCGAVRPATDAEAREDNAIVPVVAIDGLFFPVLDLLMLDVEGYELHALRGAAETIARCKPVIVVELIGQAAVYGISDEEIVGWLGERGYVCKAQVMRDCVFVWEPD